MKSHSQNILKKSIFILLTSTLVAIVLLTGCNSPDQKVKNEQSAVVEANENQQQANRELMADMNQYRRETADRIAANDSTITAFKASIANETGDLKAASEKQLAVLEQKNNNLKKKLADYKGEGKEQWETFKDQFNSDMNSLGKAFDDLTNKTL